MLMVVKSSDAKGISQQMTCCMSIFSQRRKRKCFWSQSNRLTRRIQSARNWNIPAKMQNLQIKTTIISNIPYFSTQTLLLLEYPSGLPTAAFYFLWRRLLAWAADAAEETIVSSVTVAPPEAKCSWYRALMEPFDSPSARSLCWHCWK